MFALPKPDPRLHRVEQLERMGLVMLRDWVWIKNCTHGKVYIMTDAGFDILSAEAEPRIERPSHKAV